jgi:hypothetical protein
MPLMPVSFYCPFCDLLLTASRRQVGEVIDCPRCRGGVGVPPESRLRAAPPPLPPAGPAGVVLSRRRAVALALAVGLLVGLAFAAGLLVGMFA